jgi:hypothetical protein
VLRIFRSFVWSAHLAQEGLGWVESGEEEEDLRGEVGWGVVNEKRGGEGG